MDGPTLMLGIPDMLGAGLTVGLLREGLNDIVGANVGANVGLSVCKVHRQEVSIKNINIQRVRHILKV